MCARAKVSERERKGAKGSEREREGARGRMKDKPHIRTHIRTNLELGTAVGKFLVIALMDSELLGNTTDVQYVCADGVQECSVVAHHTDYPVCVCVCACGVNMYTYTHIQMHIHK